MPPGLYSEIKLQKNQARQLMVVFHVIFGFGCNPPFDLYIFMLQCEGAGGPGLEGGLLPLDQLDLEHQQGGEQPPPLRTPASTRQPNPLSSNRQPSPLGSKL